MNLLQDAGTNWQFDIFALADATPGNTLSLLAFHLFVQAGHIEKFQLNEGKLCRYLRRIEQGYDASNPYHNSIHVASVLQMTHMLLCHGGLLKSHAFSGSLHLASYWSAVVHDFEHGGLNNDFLIKTGHPIALVYNDQSPLENHHLAAAFGLYIDPSMQYMPVSSAGLHLHPIMSTLSYSGMMHSVVLWHGMAWLCSAVLYHAMCCAMLCYALLCFALLCITICRMMIAQSMQAT